ncbi:cyclase [Actinomadura craniellae]|uniref:Cyclase n=1 Tax=Actinomadura craniellae TaxID=2231787 RepID=A0A365GWG0_9ACTN|nr:SRPBCC family protein [Actinomadura craniellae]RAY11146.1 cyclase [Actinomadura craniellae]
MSAPYDEHEARGLARALGWMSLGLGTAQLTAPRAVGRTAGVDDSPVIRALLPLVGLRELTHAAGLLRGHRPTRWAWTRVAGDAMDLAILGTALRDRRGPRRQRVAAATAAVAGITAIDLYTALRARAAAGGTGDLHLRASVTVNRPRAEAYRHWREFGNLPRFMTHLRSVDDIGEGRTRWTAEAPVKSTVSWEAELVEDLPDELIAWRSLRDTGQGPGVSSSGSVRFSDAPGGRGTEVRVEMTYAPPGGRVGAAFARLFGEHPEQQVRDDLRRFKQILETGEVARSDARPEGFRARGFARERPAQPVA